MINLKLGLIAVLLVSACSMPNGGADTSSSAAMTTPAADSTLDEGVLAFRDICLENAPDFANSAEAAARYDITGISDFGFMVGGMRPDNSLGVQLQPGSECVVTTTSRTSATLSRDFAVMLDMVPAQRFPVTTSINGQLYVIHHDRDGGEAYVIRVR